MACGFNCALYERGSIWWILWCPEVWGGGRWMRRAWFMCSFLCVITCTSAINPSALSQAHLLLLHKCHINSQEISIEKHKRGKSAGRHPGSYLWRRWKHEALPVARWGWGSPEQSRTGPGGCGPSTDRPAASLTDLLRLIWSNLCGDNRWLWEFPYSVHECDAFVYHFIWCVRIFGSQGPHQRELCWLRQDVEELHKHKWWACWRGFQRWVSLSVW